MLEALKRDLEALKSPEGYLYAGLPAKFMGLFGRDALISGWQLLNYDPGFAKAALLALAKIQGEKSDPTTGEEPGKIAHEFYSKNVSDNWFFNEKHKIKWLQKEKPIYFSVDSTPLFIIVAGKYYEKTKDEKFMRDLQPYLEEAGRWSLEYGIKDSFLRYSEVSQGKGLISQSWKDGIGPLLEEIKGPVAVVEVQGYAFLALKEAARLAQIFKWESLDGSLSQIATKLQQQFNEKFWMPEKNFYCLALDGEDRQIKATTSNPGQLLFTEIVDKNRVKAIVERLFKEDMWTSYGIRTHSTLEPDFDPFSYQRGSVWPHDNWLISQGLMKQGYRKEVGRIKEALFHAYRELGFLPEYYGVSLENKIIIDELETKPVSIQAWSTGALINFLSESRN